MRVVSRCAGSSFDVNNSERLAFSWFLLTDIYLVCGLVWQVYRGLCCRLSGRYGEMGQRLDFHFNRYPLDIIESFETAGGVSN